MKLLTTLPFSGFYNSEHEWNIDSAFEMMFADDSGRPNDALQERAWSDTDWRKVYTAYAKLYSDTLAHWSGVPFQFDELNSPREYNFTTDRIFVYITPEDAEMMRREVDGERLAAVIRERFTSRSGFISFYSPDIAEWPEDVREWDHNQLGTLVKVYCEEFSDIMEDSNGNGELDAIIYNAMGDDAKRAERIAAYLRRRAERRYCRRVSA